MSLYPAFFFSFLIIYKSLPDLPVIFNWNKFKKSVVTSLNNNEQKAKLSLCSIKTHTVKEYLGVPEYVAPLAFLSSGNNRSGRLHNLEIAPSIVSQ
jgi:hypothetical protein